MQTIFVVEDDATIRNELMALLRHNGYGTLTSDNYANLADVIEAAAPDLVLLDLSLPLTDGHLVCRQVRRVSEVPIMVVTSRDDNLNELMSLNMGADDFVAKPYNPPILLGRIASLLRRSGAGTEPSSTLSACGLQLSMAKGEATYGGASIELTKNELRILRLLMLRAGMVVSRADLQNELWQSDEFVDDNTLTVNVNRLRAALAKIGVPDTLLQTKRGLGYRLGD